MTESAFIAKNTTVWKALESALKTQAVSLHDIEVRTGLYRTVSGHLNYAQTYYPQSTLCSYLGQLVSDAHAAIYSHTQKRSIWRYLTASLPAKLRKNGPYILTSTAMFLLAVLVSFAVTVSRPSYASAFLPAEYAGITPESIQSGDTGGEWSGAIMSNYIMVNNIRVSVLALGLGLTFGIGTAYVLITNGLMLGGLAGLYFLAGRSLLFWSLILPHGVLELTAICMAGGAGLRIGYSLIRPGLYRHRDALLLSARGALGPMVLAAVLLVIAAFIEGFFTPSDISETGKLIFAAFTALPLIFYLRLGRPRKNRHGSVSLSLSDSSASARDSAAPTG